MLRARLQTGMSVAVAFAAMVVASAPLPGSCDASSAAAAARASFLLLADSDSFSKLRRVNAASRSHLFVLARRRAAVEPPSASARSDDAGGVALPPSDNGCKARLLLAVSSGNRASILRAAADLESAPSNVPDSFGVDGRWSLVFSTQTDPIAGLDDGGKGSDTVFDAINAALYRFFFRFAPVLAGAQERNRGVVRGGAEGDRREDGGSSGAGGGGGSGSGSDSSGGGLLGITVSNEQRVDTSAMGVDNRVSLRLGNSRGPRANIRVVGDLTGDNPLDLGVTFTSFSVEVPPGPMVTIPLPRPVGRLRTTYCDGDLRLSRGGRGGLFVLKRMADR